MQMSPIASPSRRPRAKSADDRATAMSRKTRARKAPTGPAPAAKDEAIDIVAPHRDSAELQGMIATAAYFLAAERNFAPGRELEDWFEAERRVCGRYFRISG